MKIKLTADARNAQAGLKATADAASDAAEEVEKLQHAADGEELEKVMERQRQAFEKEAAAIRQTNQAMREKAKLEKELAKLEEARGKNSISSQLGGMALGALAAAPGAAAAGIAALLYEAGKRQAAWEVPESHLRVSAGGDFAAVRDGVENLAIRYGTDATSLLGQADRLMKAGFTSEQAVKAMESAVVAARGDASRMESILDELVEAGTRGYLEESILGKMDENGIALRSALQQHLNMTKDELDSALSAGKIDVQSYFAVIDQLTGKGTAAQKAAEDASKTTMGALQKLKSEADSILRAIGIGVLDHLVKPLLERVLPLVEKVGDFFRARAHDPADDLISETPEGYKKLMEKKKAAEEAAAGPPPRTPEEIQAEEERLRAVEQRRDAYRSLKKAMLDASNADRWAAMSSEEKRSWIGKNTKLGSGVTVEAIDNAIRAEDGMKKLARGEEISEDDLYHTRMMLQQRQLLVELEKQEESAQRQKETAEEMLRQAERRQELLRAEIDGDTEKLQLMKLEEEVQKRAADYRKMGLDSASAEQRAAEDVALQRQAEAVRQTAPVQPEVPRVTGLIQTNLAAVGGGGVTIRQYESQALKVAKNTEQHAANLYKTSTDILTAIKSLPQSSAVMVLG